MKEYCARDQRFDERFPACARSENFCACLQADCNSPVGVLATIESEMMTLRAQVFEPTVARTKDGR